MEDDRTVRKTGLPLPDALAPPTIILSVAVQKATEKTMGAVCGKKKKERLNPWLVTAENANSALQRVTHNAMPHPPKITT